jgi:cell division protein FtsL
VTHVSATDWHEPRRGRRAGWLAVLLIVALAITLAGIFPFRQIIAQDRQVTAAEAKLDALLAENNRLEDEVAILQTPTEIERLAREDLGLVRPGEMGYSVQEMAPEVTQAADPVAEDAVDERTFVEKIWDFLTGRDLAPDG